MKKVTFITALILAAALTGCGKSNGSSSDKASTNAASTTASTEAEDTSASAKASESTEASTEKATEETTVFDYDKLQKNAEDAVLKKAGDGYEVVHSEELPHNPGDVLYFIVNVAAKGSTDISTYVSDGTTAMTYDEYCIYTEQQHEQTVWFSRGVYKTTVDGNPGGYYVFTSTTEGKVTSPQSGVGFMCEQSKDSINFHKGGIYESEIMTMSKGANGTIVGVSDGRTWTFSLLEGVDPDNFDAAEYESAETSGQNPIMNFIGNYTNGRAMMKVEPYGKNGAEINISWGSSASETSCWHMTGDVVVNGDTITVTYKDCARTDIINGASNIKYEGGTGSIVFGNTVKWQPDTENYPEENLIFRYTN